MNKQHMDAPWFRECWYSRVIVMPMRTKDGQEIYGGYLTKTGNKALDGIMHWESILHDWCENYDLTPAEAKEMMSEDFGSMPNALVMALTYIHAYTYMLECGCG